MKLYESIKLIKQLDAHAMTVAKMRLDNLTKPIGSLGVLEDIIIRIAGITVNTDIKLDKKAVIIMCADNGVVDEGISSCPKEVTATVAQNFLKGITGINVFSDLTNSDIFVVDIGIDADLKVKGIINKKIRRGTSNIVKGPAMSRDEAILAIETGIEMVYKLKEKGYNLIGTGEMGIGNTTTSSAIASVMLGIPPKELVGKGAGLTKEAFQNKIDVVNKAIEINMPDSEDAIDVLSKVGGFDIAGMVGCFIGAASLRIPIVIDGFISSIAALLAIKLEPTVRDYVFASHASAEPGAKKILEKLMFEPMLKLEMRLGEGTGAALAFQIFDAAIAAYTKMGTFQDAQIEKYVPLE